MPAYSWVSAPGPTGLAIIRFCPVRAYQYKVEWEACIWATYDNEGLDPAEVALQVCFNHSCHMKLGHLSFRSNGGTYQVSAMSTQSPHPHTVEPIHVRIPCSPVYINMAREKNTSARTHEFTLRIQLLSTLLDAGIARSECTVVQFREVHCGGGDIHDAGLTVKRILRAAQESGQEQLC